MIVKLASLFYFCNVVIIYVLRLPKVDSADDHASASIMDYGLSLL